MSATHPTAVAEKNAKEVVLSFVQALNDKDYSTARSYAHEDISFEGVLGSRSGAESYFNDMEKMQLTYDIQKAFQDGNDVCLLYDLHISGITLFGCGWYVVEDGKIRSLRVVFDPRPVLEQQQAAQKQWV